MTTAPSGERLPKRQYGQLIVDFANAKNTDNAIRTFLSSAQSIFGFSPDFAEKAWSHFLPLEDEKHFSEEEEKFLELKDKCEHYERDLFQMLWDLGYSIEHIPLSNKFVLNEIEYQPDGSLVFGPSVEVSQDDLIAFLKTNIGRIPAPEVVECYRRLVQTSEHVVTLGASFSEELWNTSCISGKGA